jgi:hypothetical protein
MNKKKQNADASKTLKLKTGLKAGTSFEDLIVSRR